jgi:phosphohistidine phosphatase
LQAVGRLIVVRHAEAGWGGGGADRDRPLTPHGLQQAARLGQKLAVLGWHPELVIHSEAVRTTQTWQRLAGPLGGAPLVVPSWSLYHEGPAAYLHSVVTHAGSTGTVALVGHNPVVGELVELLTGQRLRFGTAYAALLQAGGSEPWQGWELALGVPRRFTVQQVISG